MNFWDSASVLPLLVPEPASEAMLALFARDPQMIVRWGTRVECTSALARRVRDGAVPDSIDRAWLELARFAAAWEEVLPVESIRLRAESLLRRHLLRAADAFQLAAAMYAAEDRTPSLDFVTLDLRLAVAARAEGFRVWPAAEAVGRPSP